MPLLLFVVLARGGSALADELDLRESFGGCRALLDTHIARVAAIINVEIYTSIFNKEKFNSSLISVA